MATGKSVTNMEKYKDWYDPDVLSINPEMRMVLQEYSKIAPEDVVGHVNEIRSRGFQAMPYPCIGSYRFLNFTLLNHPRYPIILDRLKSSASVRYLDVGCCFGQDLRRLVYDGISSSQLIGVDIEVPLMELGYDIFCDRETLKSRFLMADLLSQPVQNDVWAELAVDKFDIVHCSAVFHLFSRPKQVLAAQNVARLVKPGGMIVGRQSGNVKAGEILAAKVDFTTYRHNVESWRELWEEVGAATGAKWQVEGTMRSQVSKISMLEDENSRILLFTIQRIE